jgi:TPR repeat protein
MNKNKALQLSREAAERGHAVAQLNLGMEFALEETVAIEQDAFRYIWLAAKQGFTSAEYLLGHTYCRAEVAAKEKTLERGKVWLARAAAKGHEQAQARLAELDA